MKTLLVLVALFSISSFSAPQSTKDSVQKEMKSFVNNLVGKNGFMPILHEGKILKLELLTSKKYPDGFHAGVKEQGDLYASCADFKDAKGNTYDVDFLVSKISTGFQVVQPLVHSINGKKSKYDLKH